MNKISLMLVLVSGLALSACGPASGPPAGMGSNAIAVATLQKITDDLIAAHGLKPDEYQRILRA
jgi:hypothetical protein